MFKNFENNYEFFKKFIDFENICKSKNINGFEKCSQIQKMFTHLKNVQKFKKLS